MNLYDDTRYRPTPPEFETAESLLHTLKFDAHRIVRIASNQLEELLCIIEGWNMGKPDTERLILPDDFAPLLRLRAALRANAIPLPKAPRKGRKR